MSCAASSILGARSRGCRGQQQERQDPAQQPNQVQGYGDDHASKNKVSAFLSVSQASKNKGDSSPFRLVNQRE
jgi:hypothetical protein